MGFPIEALRLRNPGGGGSPTIYNGVIAEQVGSQSPGSGGTFAFSSHVYDRTGWHDDVTNNSRITIGSTGLYWFGFNTINDPGSGAIPRMTHSSGTDPVGSGAQATCATSVNVFSANFASAILALNAADYLTIISSSFGGTYKDTDSIAGSGFGWFFAEPISGSIKYALANKSANQSLSANTLTTITFDQEVADTNGFHDNVTNNSRHTVPSGVTCVELVGQIGTGSFGGAALAQITMGGSLVVGLPRKQSDSSGTTGKNVNVISAPIVVTTGNYFELQAQLAAASTVNAVARTFFQISEVDPSIKRALASNSSAQALAAATATILSFDTESYDTSSIHGFAATVTITIASPGVVTWNAHGFAAGTPIVLATTGALPTGLTAGTIYYVVSPTTNTFQLATAPGGAAINTSGSQSGTHTASNYSRFVMPAGCTQAQAVFCVGGASQTGAWRAWAIKNGSSFNGSALESTNVSGADCVSARSAWVDASPGDVFECMAYSANARNTDNAVTWFAMKFR